MRFLYVLILFLFACISMRAQDVMFLQNGDEVQVKVLEILDNELIYKRWDNLDGPSYRAKKNDVFMVKYANGTKEKFGVSNNNNTTSPSGTLENKPENPETEDKVQYVKPTKAIGKDNQAEKGTMRSMGRVIIGGGVLPLIFFAGKEGSDAEGFKLWNFNAEFFTEKRNLGTIVGIGPDDGAVFGFLGINYYFVGNDKYQLGAGPMFLYHYYQENTYNYDFQNSLFFTTVGLTANITPVRYLNLRMYGNIGSIYGISKFNNNIDEETGFVSTIGLGLGVRF